MVASTCSSPGINNFQYFYSYYLNSPYGSFVNGTGYQFNATGGVAPIVNCQETILFLEGSDGAKRVAKKKKPTKLGSIYNTITNNYAMVLDSPSSLKACFGAWSFINETDPSCPLTTTGCFVNNMETYFYEDDPDTNPGVGFCGAFVGENYRKIESCAYECYEKNYDRANTNAFTSGYDMGNSKVVDIDYDGDTHPEEVSIAVFCSWDCSSLRITSRYLLNLSPPQVYTISYKSSGWNPLFRP